MAMDGEWSDWIVLWGLVNMLEIPVAIVSSLGETGLNVIYPADYQNETQAPGDWPCWAMKLSFITIAWNQ